MPRGVETQTFDLGVGRGREIGLSALEVCPTPLMTFLGLTSLTLFFLLNGTDALGFGLLALLCKFTKS